MTTQEIIQLIVTALGAGGLGSFFTWRISNRKQDNSDFGSVSSEYKELLDAYKNEVIELRKEVKELRDLITKRDLELQQVRNQLMIFESSHADVPIPMWLKDTDGKMLFINTEYERMILNPIGKTAKEYLGNFDSEIWGEDLAATFKTHDRKIMLTKKPEQFIESWPGANGKYYKGEVIKYPRFLGRTIIGIGGLIINIEEIDETTNTE